MEVSVQFNIVALSTSGDMQSILNEILEPLDICARVFKDSSTLLHKLDEDASKIILLHTDIGIDSLMSTLKAIKNNEVSCELPIVVVSDLKDNETLALDLKNDKVISILSYKNWKYQFSVLLNYLHTDKQGHKNNAKDEVLQNPIDALTNVLKWSGAQHTFDSLVSDFKDNERPFSLIMFGLDKLDDIKTSHGDDVGDEVIVSISSIAEQNIRRDDTILRLDTVTFGVFLSGANLEIAKTKAESFRYEIQVKGHGFDKIKATASFSVLEYKENDSLEELTSLGKTLVLQAKNEGGNKLILD